MNCCLRPSFSEKFESIKPAETAMPYKTVDKPISYHSQEAADQFTSTSKFNFTETVSHVKSVPGYARSPFFFSSNQSSPGSNYNAEKPCESPWNKTEGKKLKNVRKKIRKKTFLDTL